MKKKFIILVMCFMFFGCGDKINLLQGEIYKKVTINDEYSEYEIIKNDDLGWNHQYIVASPDFAEVGDVIGSKDGVIKVIRIREKNEIIKKKQKELIKKSKDIAK